MQCVFVVIWFTSREGSCDCLFDYYGPNCENQCDLDTCSEHGMCLGDGLLVLVIKTRFVSL